MVTIRVQFQHEFVAVTRWIERFTNYYPLLVSLSSRHDGWKVRYFPDKGAILWAFQLFFKKRYLLSLFLSCLGHGSNSFASQVKMSVFHGVKMSLHITPLKLMKYNVTIYFINTLFMLVTVLCFVILIARHYILYQYAVYASYSVVFCYPHRSPQIQQFNFHVKRTSDFYRKLLLISISMRWSICF